MHSLILLGLSGFIVTRWTSASELIHFFQIMKSNVYINLGIFLVSPGEGRDYTYSPVGVNATLDCKVASNDLEWSINGTRFGRENQRNFLTNRGIFQSELVSSSDGLSSTVFVFGNISNNASMVCCQSFLEGLIMMSCTTLIVYGELIKFTSEYN